jgi:ElaB/YqjD/DUF883 family membrane-anchored ribosome-binding protein
MSRLTEEVAQLEARLATMSADDRELDERVRKAVKKALDEDVVPETWDGVLKFAAAVAVFIGALWALILALKFMFTEFP